MKVAGVTKCPTGIAHTYMAAERLELTGKKLGYEMYVETQGSQGTENQLTEEQIREADYVIIAADIVVDGLERFAGKKIYRTPIKPVLRDTEQVFRDMTEKAVVEMERQPQQEEENVLPMYRRKNKEQSDALLHQLMNGASYMIPFVVVGGLLIGFEKEISREEFARRIEEDTLLEVLHKVPVHKGDVLFIEAGTIHAIGRGILVAEIQQNSNVTYRVYDYGRVGKDGKKRELHVDKALDVTKRAPATKDASHYPHIADCDYFTVDKLNLNGGTMESMGGVVTEESFLSLLVLDGEGILINGDEAVSFKKGDSIFLPAGSGAYTVKGVCDGLLTTIRAQA